jgi:hypothetical protein
VLVDCRLLSQGAYFYIFDYYTEFEFYPYPIFPAWFPEDGEPDCPADLSCNAIISLEGLPASQYFICSSIN